MKELEQFNAKEYEKITLLMARLQQLLAKINQQKLAHEQQIAIAQAEIIAIIRELKIGTKKLTAKDSIHDLTSQIEAWFNAIVAEPALAKDIPTRIDTAVLLKTYLEQLRNIDQHLVTMIFAPVKINLPANTPTVTEKKIPVAGIEVEYKYCVIDATKQRQQLAEVKITTKKADYDFSSVTQDAFKQALKAGWQNFTVNGGNQKQQLEVLKFISHALNEEQKQLKTISHDENAVHRLALLCSAVVVDPLDAEVIKLAQVVDQQKNAIKATLQQYDINNLPISTHTKTTAQVAAIKLDTSKSIPITQEKKATPRPPVDKFSVNEIKPNIQTNATANKLIDVATDDADKVLTNTKAILAACYLMPVNDALRLMWANNLSAAQASLAKLKELRGNLNAEQSTKIAALKEQLQSLVNDVNHPLAIDIHQRAKEISQGYLEQSKQLFSNLPKKELSELDEKKRPNCAKITQHFQSISISVVMDILAYSSPIERKLVMEKWVQVMDDSFFAGDFVTLFAIAAAFGTAAITRLKASFELMSPEYREKLKQYEQFPEIAGQYKKYQEVYKSRDGMLPFLGIHFSHLEFAKRGNKEPKISEIIHRLTDELVGKIENFIGKKLPESIESTTKIITLGKDDYEMINKQQYDISLKQEPRNLPENVLRVINPELRNFLLVKLLAKNVTLTEKQLVELNNLVQEPDEQALVKILAQLHIPATNLEVKKFNSLNKQIYSIVSQASPVDKSVNEKYLSLLNKNVYADLLAEMIRNYLVVGSGKIISQSGRSVKEVMEDINKIIIDLATQPKADRSSAEKYLRDLLIETGFNFSQEELLSKVVANLLGNEALSKIAIEVKQIANRVLFPINYKTLAPSDLKIKELRINSALERLNALLSEVNTSAGRGKLGEYDAAVQYLTREINQATIALTQLKMTLSTINQKLKAGELIIAVTAKAPIQYQAEKITPVVGADNVVVVALTGKELPASFDEFISSLPANARIDIIADLKQSNVALAIQEAAKKFNATARENLYVNYAKASSLAPVAEVKATVLPEELPSQPSISTGEKKSPIKQGSIGEKFKHTIKQQSVSASSTPPLKTTAPVAVPEAEAQSKATVKPENLELKNKLTQEIVMALVVSQVERMQQIMPFDKLYTAVKQSVVDGKVPADLTLTEVSALAKLDNSLIEAFQDVTLYLEKNSIQNKQGADDLMPLVINKVISRLKTISPKVITAWQEIAAQYSVVDSGKNGYVYASVNIAIEYIQRTVDAIKFPEDFISHFSSRPEEREFLLLGLKHNLFGFNENDLRKTIDWVQTQPFKLSKNEHALVNDLDNVFTAQKESNLALESKKAIDPEMVENFKRIVAQEVASFEQLQLQKKKLSKNEFNSKLADINNVISSWQNKLQPGRKNNDLQDLRDGSLKTNLPFSEGIKQLQSQANEPVMKKRREAFSLVSAVALIPRFIPQAVDKIIAFFKKKKPAKHKQINKVPTINANVPVDEAVELSKQKIIELENKEAALKKQRLNLIRKNWITKHLVPEFLLQLTNQSFKQTIKDLNACRKNIESEKKKLLTLQQELAVINEISEKNGEIEDYSKKITELLVERNKVELEIFTTIKNSWLQGVATKLLFKPIKSSLLKLFNPKLNDYEAQAKVNAKEIYLTLDHITRVLQSFLADTPKVYDANTVAKLNNDLNLLNNLYSQIHPNDKQGKLATQITTLREQIIVILLKYIDDRTTKGTGEKDIKQLTGDLQQLQRCAECKGINSKLKIKLKHEIAELERTIDKVLEQLKQSDKLSPNNTSALFQKEKPPEKGVTSEPEQEMKEDKKIQLKL